MYMYIYIRNQEGYTPKHQESVRTPGNQLSGEYAKWNQESGKRTLQISGIRNSARPSDAVDDNNVFKMI